VDAEKALIKAYQSVCYSAHASDCNHVHCQSAREHILTLARAAFEAGQRHSDDSFNATADLPLPKWLTETSR